MNDEARAKDNSEYYERIDIHPSPEDPRRLVFVASKSSPSDIPDDVLSLRNEYQKSARVAGVLFENDLDTRRDIFSQLHQGSDRGLRGPDFSVRDGRANLAMIREHLTDCALKVRDKMLRDYSVLAFFFGVLPLVAGGIFLITGGFGFFDSEIASDTQNGLLLWCVAALWITAGAAICVWAEFALRMQSTLTYETLLSMDPSRWRPSQRVLITVGISFVFAFLLAFDAFQIGVGNLLLNDFIDKTPAISIAVGGVTGLAFPTVRDILYRMEIKSR